MAKAYNTAPQAAYCNCSGVFVSQDGRTAYGLRSPSPRTRTDLGTKQLYAALIGLVIVSYSEGWKAELAWLVDP